MNARPFSPLLLFAFAAALLLACTPPAAHAQRVSSLPRTNTIQGAAASNLVMVTALERGTNGSIAYTFPDFAALLEPYYSGGAGVSITLLNTTSNALVSYANGTTNASIVRQTQLTAASNDLYSAIITSGVTNAVTSTNGNQFAGVPLSIKAGSTETNKVLYPSSINSRPLTIYGMQGQDTDHLRVNDYLGNILFGIDETGALFGEGATDSPRLTGTSTAGYVWTASGTDGKGSWTAPVGGVTNAVLTNLVATGAVTNKFNRWQFWVSPENTNSYFAENRGLGIITNSSDFGALMQSVLNRGVDGFHFELFGNPYYNAHYVVSNTVVFTNWGTIKGDGNPSTTVRGKSGMTTAVFQLGDATHFNSGINRFEELRMEGEGTSAGSMGFHVVNSAEPVFHKLECTGFLMAGIRVSTLYNTAWAEATDCWFVQKGVNSHGILFDLAPSTAINQNHFAIRNCIFGNHTSGGTAITVSNWFPGLLVENSHFRNYPAIAGGGINVYAGQSFSFVGNQFQGFGGTYGIIFADRTAATNYGSSVVGNYGHTYSAEAAQNALVYIGENVQGIFSSGNYVRGVDGPTVVDVGVTNGPRNNFDQSELRLGSLAQTNTMLNVDGSGIVTPTTLSGATFSGSTLTISQQTNSSIVRQTQLTASSNALVTLSSNNVRVAAGSGVSVASAGSGGVQTFTVTATGGSGGTSNSIPVVTIITNVNIGFGSMQSLAMTTPSNQFVNFQGTETNGDTVELAVTNSAATNITITFNLDGTTSSYYDPTAGTNRSSFVVSPGGKILTFVYSTNWGAIWRLNAYIGRELELATAKGFGVGLLTSTNGDTITLTATRTNAITYAATNTTSLHIDWTGTEHVIIPNLLETNLVLIPTNMIVGRELYLTFLPGSLNYNISISNAAGTRVRWNLATNSGNAALTKTNTIQVEASLLYQTNGISAAVGRFIY